MPSLPGGEGVKEFVTVLSLSTNTHDEVGGEVKNTLRLFYDVINVQPLNKGND